MNEKYNKGSIEIITGPMYSGKSEELLRKFKTLWYVGFNSLIIKPKFDNRFSETEIVSRAGTKCDTYTLEDINEIYSLLKKEHYDSILIDEAHFFSEDIIKIADDLANKGYLVVIAGLDQDYLHKPFGPMPQLMAIAERVTKLNAICVICKNLASMSYRKIDSEEQRLLGDYNEYEPRCRRCYNLGKNIKK
ncbi:thymidine kinase [Mycoplasma enhydrae]|uniref:thymidine kinase n=1 Tax=Mycoplasma enhydrae TaxID=2499220 RepID=UPI00197C4C9D|nr:thymidine kinase [Mycoplasma enhydrae]MBN4089244.1 thymidine kinase [Mycoplasma enhydrae]MCV3733596.1 thymidine kinase [Mycoplasma enhydrae]MCV3753428.1 thymidine kinase [Mycoplasma enhydrae]